MNRLQKLMDYVEVGQAIVGIFVGVAAVMILGFIALSSWIAGMIY